MVKEVILCKDCDFFKSFEYPSISVQFVSFDPYCPKIQSLTHKINKCTLHSGLTDPEENDYCSRGRCLND